MFFRPQRKFNHTFQQLIGWKTNEVAQNEFLGVKAYKVPELKRLGTRCVNEISTHRFVQALPLCHCSQGSQERDEERSWLFISRCYW